MGMPISVEIAGDAPNDCFEQVFAHFMSVDERFSTYKEGSEISRINRGELPEGSWSSDMRDIFALAEQTRQETGGYFDLRRPDGMLDPSGVVKGWAIRNAAYLLEGLGAHDFYVDAGGDIASQGHTAEGAPWSVGIRNPFSKDKIVKVIYPKGRGVATSGTYIRGQHIYNPHDPGRPITDIVSLTVVGPDVCEADRFATAGFAMGMKGVAFIEAYPGLEGYGIDRDGIAAMTSGFANHTEL